MTEKELEANHRLLFFICYLRSWRVQTGYSGIH